MSKPLENELSRLKSKLLTLSALVEERVYQAVRSISERNSELASRVLDGDEEIDDMEVEIEEDCLKILALHQPVALDLRFVVASLKINNDLERIGDLAVNIAERSIFLAGQPPVRVPFDFDDMAQKTRTMLKHALDAMIQFNSKLANQVCLADEEVDEINREMYHKVYSEIKRTPDDVIPLIHFLSVSRHLERIADYATNIAEDVMYIVEGKIFRHKPEEFRAGSN